MLPDARAFDPAPGGAVLTDAGSETTAEAFYGAVVGWSAADAGQPGKLQRGPDDIPDVGRFAVVADLGGAF